MKKLFVTVIAVILFLAFSNAAYAYLNGWELNLSTVVAGLGDHKNIDRLDVNGSSTVTQSFGADHLFNNGDSFSEFSLLSSIVYFTEPGNAVDIKVLDLNDGTTTYNLYAYATGLTGSVYNVNVGDPTDPSTWSFEYAFTPGVGDIGMYLDTDFDPTNAGTITLTKFTIVDPSGGIGNPGFLGGAANNGTTNLTMLFTPGTVQNNVFLDKNGLDFSSLVPPMYALGLVNTNNLQAFDESGNPLFNITYDAQQLPTGFVSTINSAGQFNVAIVPEPTSMLLLGMGILGLVPVVRRKKAV